MLRVAHRGLDHPDVKVRDEAVEKPLVLAMRERGDTCRARDRRYGLTALDIGLRTLVDAGAPPPDALAVFGAAMVERNGFQCISAIEGACTSWGKAAAARPGGTYFAGAELN